MYSMVPIEYLPTEKLLQSSLDPQPSATEAVSHAAPGFAPVHEPVGQ